MIHAPIVEWDSVTCEHKTKEHKGGGRSKLFAKTNIAGQKVGERTDDN